MPTFSFTLPDGREFEISGEDGLTQEQAWAALVQQQPDVAQDSPTLADAPQPSGQPSPLQEARGPQGFLESLDPALNAPVGTSLYEHGKAARDFFKNSVVWKAISSTWEDKAPIAAQALEGVNSQLGQLSNDMYLAESNGLQGSPGYERLKAEYERTREHKLQLEGKLSRDISDRDATTEQLQQKFEELHKLDQAYTVLTQSGKGGSEAAALVKNKMDQVHDEAFMLQGGFSPSIGESISALGSAIVDDPGSVSANLINVMAQDPEFLLTPVGYERAAAATAQLGRALSTAAGLAGATATAAVINIPISAMQQKEEKGFVDFDQVRNESTIAGLTGGALVGGLKGLGKLVPKGSELPAKVPLKEKVNKQLNEYETFYNRAVDSGATEGDAHQVASTVIGVNPAWLYGAQKIADRTINLKPALAAESTLEALEKTSALYAFSREAANPSLINKAIEPITSTIEKFSPEVAGKLRKMDANVAFMIHDLTNKVNPFLEKVFGENKVHGTLFGKKSLFDAQDQLTISHHLANGRFNIIERMLNRKDPTGALAKDFQGVKDTLKGVLSNLEKVGYKIKEKENYFPRMWKDVGAMKAEEQAGLAKYLNKATKAKGAKLTDAEIAKATDQYMLRGRMRPVGARTSGSLRRRKIREVTIEDVQGNLVPPPKAIHSYIRAMSADIERRKFIAEVAKYIGADFSKSRSIKKYADATGFDIPKMISLMSREAIAKGKLAPFAAQRMEKLLSARFGTGELSPNNAIQHAKNVMYAVALGNPIAAITQAADVAISMYNNGMLNTLSSVFGRKVFTPKMMGLIDASEELFSKTSWSRRVLNFSMRNFGFQKMDSFGKSVQLTAAFRKHNKMVQTEKGRLAFLDKYAPIYGDQVHSLIRELRMKPPKSGEDLVKASENMRHFMWSQLAETQPIALSEMPEAYLNMPNGRVFYMMKSFGLKQLDKVRRDTMREFNSGNYSKAMWNFLKFSTLFALGGASVQTFKQWLVGGFDGEKWEEFPDQVVWNLISLFSINTFSNKYAIKKNRGDLSHLITDSILPPIGIIFNPLSKAFLQKESHPEELVGLVPGVGRPAQAIIKANQ